MNNQIVYTMNRIEEITQNTRFYIVVIQVLHRVTLCTESLNPLTPTACARHNLVAHHVSTAALPLMEAPVNPLSDGHDKAVSNATCDQRTWKKSFASVTAGQQGEICLQATPIECFENSPDIIFYDDEVASLEQTMNFTLIGKFDGRKPRMDRIRKIFDEMSGLNGPVRVLWLDYKHIILKFQNDLDYNRFFGKEISLDRCPMRTIKWAKNFNPEVESSVVPIWIGFPNLPLHLYMNKSALMRLATGVGKPLMMDEPTSQGTRPALARIRVEFDIKGKRPKAIHVQTRDRKTGYNITSEGFWQAVNYEFIPQYCDDCKQVGHSRTSCVMRRKATNSNVANSQERGSQEMGQNENNKTERGQHGGTLRRKEQQVWTKKPENAEKNKAPILVGDQTIPLNNSFAVLPQDNGEDDVVGVDCAKQVVLRKGVASGTSQGPDPAVYVPVGVLAEEKEGNKHEAGVGTIMNVGVNCESETEKGVGTTEKQRAVVHGIDSSVEVSLQHSEDHRNHEGVADGSQKINVREVESGNDTSERSYGNRKNGFDTEVVAETEFSSSTEGLQMAALDGDSKDIPPDNEQGLTVNTSRLEERTGAGSKVNLPGLVLEQSMHVEEEDPQIRDEHVYELQIRDDSCIGMASASKQKRRARWPSDSSPLTTRAQARSKAKEASSQKCDQ